MTKTKEELQTTAFTMIGYIGSAKSSYLEAIYEAKNGNFEQAEKLIDEGNDFKIKGHEEHFELIQLEANGHDLPFSLILAHAEDQLMTTEVYLNIAEESISTHKLINKLEERVVALENK